MNFRTSAKSDSVRALFAGLSDVYDVDDFVYTPLPLGQDIEYRRCLKLTSSALHQVLPAFTRGKVRNLDIEQLPHITDAQSAAKAYLRLAPAAKKLLQTTPIESYKLGEALRALCEALALCYTAALGKNNESRPLGYETSIGDQVSRVVFYAVDSGAVTEKDLLPHVVKMIESTIQTR
jgi:hypothetical protein